MLQINNQDKSSECITNNILFEGRFYFYFYFYFYFELMLNYQQLNLHSKQQHTEKASSTIQETNSLNYNIQISPNKLNKLIPPIKMALDRQKCMQLLVGTFGIYFSYLAVGLIQQWLLKYPYKSLLTGQQEVFTSTISLVLFPHLVTLIIGKVYNRIMIKQEEKTHIPQQNSMICAFFVLLGGITFNYAIKWTSYPIVITAKSCNILSVILVSVFCSRVTDKKLKLGGKKIIVGIVVSLGILLFKYFDPEVKQGEEKKFQLIGFVVLIVSMLADGFLPDFQAEIKSRYHPKPTQMMVEINKWVSIYCIVYVLLAGESLTAIIFALTHELFAFHLISLSLLVCIGHFIIYRMIKSFKQHIVPFVITTRKVITVCISLVFYHHKTHPGQIIGIFIVLAVVVYQFANEIMVKGRNQQQGNIMQKVNQNQCELEVEKLKVQEMYGDRLKQQNSFVKANNGSK